MERFYLVYADGAQRGPYSVSQLENFRRNGELPSDSMVWTEGMADWQPIATVLTTTAPSRVPNISAPTQMKPVVAFTDTGSVKESDYTFVLITHILMAASVIIGITSIAAVIMAHIKREEVRGTYLESHCKWLIETFWWSFGIGALGVILSFVFIGIPILFGVAIWFIYRVIMGVIRISERRAL